jgi:hypothetical protein
MTGKTFRTRSGNDREQTRRDFLFARVQVCAHMSAAEYMRVRDLGRRAARTSSPEHTGATTTP